MAQEEFEHFSPIAGTCLTMCPVKEIFFREQNNLIHYLERGVEKNTERFVKKYQRSAAGVVQEISSIRPPQVLQKTVHHLLNNVLSQYDVNYNVIYNFIQDRLRSVRQDLIIQQSPESDCIPLLEPMVRFYAYSYFKMGNNVSCDFDPLLNHNHLLECLKWLLCLYDRVAHRSPERIEMEAIYILLNLGDPVALSRSLRLPKYMRGGLILTSEEISIAWYDGNYVKACKMLVNLPPLLAALTVAAHLANIRRYAFQVMSAAYNSKNLMYPLTNLKSILLYNNEEEVSRDCCHYNLSCDGKYVHFSKENFILKENYSVNCISLSILEKKLNSAQLPELVLFPAIT